MSRVSALAAAGRSAVAKFHELRLKYWNRDLDAICCFEGSDDIEFFMPHVRSELGLHRDRIDFVNCAGKTIVVTLWGWVLHRSWNMARLGFFVDRDLDDFLDGNPAGDQLYLTDFYSIESHVLGSDFFDQVWQDLFRLPITDPRRLAWKSAYYSGAEKFAEIVLPICYTALAFKRGGSRVDFDRISLVNLVTINDRGEVLRCPRSGGRDYSKVFVGASPSLALLRASRLELKGLDMKMWLRGKFAIWFSMTFFTRMKGKLGRRAEPNRAIVRAFFNEETAITCLCARSSIPMSLRSFLGTWSASIVRDGLVPIGART